MRSYQLIFLVFQDIDECLEFTFQCQDESQKCKNTRGSYKCVCDEGLYWIDNKCKGKKLQSYLYLFSLRNMSYVVNSKFKYQSITERKKMSWVAMESNLIFTSYTYLHVSANFSLLSSKNYFNPNEH